MLRSSSCLVFLLRIKLVSTLFYSILLLPLFCIQPCESGPADVIIPKKAQGRIFFLSANAPITSILNTSPSVVNSTQLIIHHFEHVSRFIRFTLRSHRTTRHHHHHLNTTDNQIQRSVHTDDDSSNEIADLSVCNSPNTQWANAARVIARSNGWPAYMPTCISDLYGIPTIPNIYKNITTERTNTKSTQFTDSMSRSNENDNTDTQYSLSELRNALTSRVSDVQELTGRIREAIASNWSTIIFRANDSMVRQNIVCDMYFAVGYRIFNRWYLSTSFTNAPQSHWVRDSRRHIILEYIGMDTTSPQHFNHSNGNPINSTHHKSLHAINITLPVNPGPNGSNIHKLRSDATTRWSIRQGASSTSAFYFQTAEESEAMSDALERAQLTVHHADDALLWSNIAILGLPIFLNLIPVSLVTNIRSRRTLIYVCATRLVAAVPMIIKGVEVVSISKQEFTSAFTRIGGSLSPDINNIVDRVIAAELWIAQCKADSNIGNRGIVLICISIGSIIVGIAIELMVRQCGRSRYESFLAVHRVPTQVKDDYYRSSLMKDIDLEY